MPVATALLTAALAVVQQGFGVDRLPIGGVHDSLALSGGQCVFSVLHVGVVVARTGAGIVTRMLMRIAIDPQIELVASVQQLAVASHTLHRYAAGSRAGAVIFHDEILL